MNIFNSILENSIPFIFLYLPGVIFSMIFSIASFEALFLPAEILIFAALMMSKYVSSNLTLFFSVAAFRL